MKNYARYATGVILIIIAILIIVFGFRAIKGAFSSNDDAGSKTTEQTKASKPKVDLLAAPKNNVAVRYTIRGPITANEDRRSVRITVDRDNRTVEVLQGYSDTVIKTETIANNQEAYQAFVDALNGAGFTKTIEPSDKSPEGQLCPLGRHYNFEYSPGMSDSLYTWSTNCNVQQGTFGGNYSTVNLLFREQIPNFSKFTSDVKL